MSPAHPADRRPPGLPRPISAPGEPSASRLTPVLGASEPASGVAVKPVAAVDAAAQMLDGDEIVELTLKPSLWYIVIAAFKFVLGTLLAAGVLLAAAQNGLIAPMPLLVQLCFFAAGARAAFAAVQWASRLYILTNRRVMRFRGILKVEGAECRLNAVANATLHVAWYQRWLRLGTIRITPAEPGAIPLAWEQVARPTEVYERLLRAIRRSHGG